MPKYVTQADMYVSAAINPGLLNFYVSTTGSDSNDGLSPATSFQTVTGLWNNLPPSFNGGIRVRFASGTYVIPSSYPTGGGPYREFCIPKIVGTNTGGNFALLGGYDTLFTGTVTAISATGGGSVGRITDPSITGTFASGALFGKLFTVTSGTGVGGVLFRIVGNDASGNVEFATNGGSTLPQPASGSTYAIVQPNVTLQYDHISIKGDKSAMVYMNGIKWQGVTQSGSSGNPDCEIFGVRMCTAGTDWALGSGTFLLNAVNWERSIAAWNFPDLSGSYTLVYGYNAPACFSSSKSTGTPVTWALWYGSSFYGTLVGANLNCLATFGSYMLDLDMYLTRSMFTVNEMARVQAQNNSWGANRLQRMYASPGNAFTVERGGSVILGSFDISNATGDAIFIGDGGFARIQAITGSGNSGWGVRVKSGGQAVISGTVTSSVSGALGEILVGTITGTWATINGASSSSYCDQDNNAYLTVAQGAGTVNGAWSNVLSKSLQTPTPSFGEIFVYTSPGATGQQYALTSGTVTALTGFVATGTMDPYGGVSGTISSGILTAVSGGYYHAMYTLSYGDSVPNENDFYIQKSGTAGWSMLSASNQHINVPNGSTVSVVGQAFVSMSAGDKIQLYTMAGGSVTITLPHINLRLMRVG